MSPEYFPDAIALSDEVFLFHPHHNFCSADPNVVSPRLSGTPSTIMVFGWGDASPRNLRKYIVHYRHLFPASTIVLITCSTMRANFRSRASARQAVRPAVEVLSQSPEMDGKIKKILVHVFSNSGLVNFLAACELHRELFKYTIPRHLLILDSTPGGDLLRKEYRRWSFGVAAGVAPYLPWPKVFTRILALLWIICSIGLPTLYGAENLARRSRRSLNDMTLLPCNSARLYVYSATDEIIGWREVEEHAAEASDKGWYVQKMKFEDTAHVGHMKVYPEAYWEKIVGTWDSVIEHTV